MCYDNEVVTYDNKTVAIFETEIFFVGKAETKNPFANHQCLIASFIYLSKEIA